MAVEQLGNMALVAYIIGLLIAWFVAGLVSLWR